MRSICPTLETVSIPSGDVALAGSLVVPAHATALVIFAHGGGDARHSPRNLALADALHRERLATLVFDLLTEAESLSYWLRFDIDLLTHRLLDATRWARKHPALRRFPLGFFGASTGAAAALRASATLGQEVQAIVARGGRVDRTGPLIGDVQASVLIIAGERDRPIVDIGTLSLPLLQRARESKLAIVRGASHLFQEPGALKHVADLACSWFVRHLKN